MRTKQYYISIIKMHKDLSEEGKQKLYDILENNEFTEEVEKCSFHSKLTSYSAEN